MARSTTTTAAMKADPNTLRMHTFMTTQVCLRLLAYAQQGRFAPTSGARFSAGAAPGLCALRGILGGGGGIARRSESAAPCGGAWEVTGGQKREAADAGRKRADAALEIQLGGQWVARLDPKTQASVCCGDSSNSGRLRSVRQAVRKALAAPAGSGSSRLRSDSLRSEPCLAT